MVTKYLATAAAIMLLAGCALPTKTVTVEVKVPVYRVPQPPAIMLEPPISGELPTFSDPNHPNAFVGLTLSEYAKLQKVINELVRSLAAWPLWLDALNSRPSAMTNEQPGGNNHAN